MYQEEKVSITISIAKGYRDRLRTMAAQQNLHNTDQLTSASTIAREIICEHIDELDRIEASFVEAGVKASQDRVTGNVDELMSGGQESRKRSIENIKREEDTMNE